MSSVSIIRRRVIGLLTTSIEIMDSSGKVLGIASAKHFPRNGDIVFTTGVDDSTEVFRLNAEESNNWVHHYSLIAPSYGKLGAFFQREKKPSNPEDWVFRDETGAERAVLIDRTRGWQWFGQVTSVFAPFVPHCLELTSANGGLVAQYKKVIGFRYALQVSVGQAYQEFDNVVVMAAGGLAAIHNYRIS